MKKLKPCPFCDGEAKILELYGGWAVAVCDECGTVSKGYRTEAEAAEFWNTRTERVYNAEAVTAFHCTKCGTTQRVNYCPNCGAKAVKDE